MMRYSLRKILSLSVLILHRARLGDPETGEELGVVCPGQHSKLPTAPEASRRYGYLFVLGRLNNSKLLYSHQTPMEFQGG